MRSPLAMSPVTPACLSDREKSSRRAWLLSAAFIWMVVRAASLLAEKPPEVTAVNGGLGPCTADFTVSDNSNKPIYDAKIHVTILYGFMNKRRQDLEVGTNSDGKARFEGLPNKLKKKPLEFQVRSGQQTKSVPIDPETDCQANSTVILGSQ